MWRLPIGTAQNFTLTVRWPSGSGCLLCRFLSVSRVQRETNSGCVDLGLSPAAHTWMMLCSCVCALVCVSVWACVSVYVCAYRYVCIYTYLYVCVHVCLCVSLSVWCVCMCTCVYTCVCVHVCVCLVCLCVHIHIFTLMCVDTYVCTSCMPDIYRGQERILAPVELELGMVLNYCSENQTPEASAWAASGLNSFANHLCSSY